MLYTHYSILHMYKNGVHEYIHTYIHIYTGSIIILCIHIHTPGQFRLAFFFCRNVLRSRS